MGPNSQTEESDAWQKCLMRPMNIRGRGCLSQEIGFLHEVEIK